MIRKVWLGGVTAALLLAAGSAGAQTTDEKLEALSREVEALRQQVQTQDGKPAGSRVNVGGYGELHYNNLEDASGNDTDTIDFHRFVLFFGYNFTDRIRFHSELELEHALVKDTNTAAGGSATPGEVELEQAYVDFDLMDDHTARGGLFLIPVGILNETHEPPTFYGVERNPIENNIIPSTWWEGGAALYGNLAPGLRYDFAVTSGLAVTTGTGTSAYSIRGGRKKVANAPASDPMYTARLKWTGVPGLEIAGTVQYHQDITQSALADSVPAMLLEAHAALTRGPFGLRALYAQWDLDGAEVESLGRDKQTGWYIEPSYKITPKFGIFTRYNQWDLQAGDGADSKRKQLDVGFNYWPHEQVVVKVDVQDQSGIVSTDGLNVGIGYMF